MVRSRGRSRSISGGSYRALIFIYPDNQNTESWTTQNIFYALLTVVQINRSETVQCKSNFE